MSPPGSREPARSSCTSARNPVCRPADTMSLCLAAPAALLSRIAFQGSLLLGVLGLGVLAACGSSEEPPAEHYFRVEEREDGVVVATTSSVPKYEEPLFAYAEVVRLQQDDSIPESLLYRGGSPLVGDDGCFYMADFGDDRIVVYNPDGTYRNQIGRRGDGPGEFQSPRILWIRDGCVAVYDSRHRRTCLFSRDGELLRIHSYPRASVTFTAIYPRSDGGMALLRSIYDRKPDGSSTRWYELTVVGAEGDTVATVLSQPLESGPFVTVENISFSPPVTFQPSGSIHYQPDVGVVNYWGGRPEFEVYTTGGALQRIIRLDLEAQPVTEADRQGVMRNRREALEGVEDEQSRMINEAFLEHTRFNDVKPFYGSVRMDDYGFFWLSYGTDYTVEDVTEVTPRLRVLSPEGEYLGDTSYPLRSGIVSRGLLCSMQADEETGETDYIIYRISSAVPGFVYP